MLTSINSTTSWDGARDTFKRKFAARPMDRANIIAEFGQCRHRFVKRRLDMIDHIHGHVVGATMRHKLSRRIRYELFQDASADIAAAELKAMQKGVEELERCFRADMACMVQNQTKVQIGLIAQTMHSFTRESALKRSQTVHAFEELQCSNTLKDAEQATLNHAFRLYEAFIQVPFDRNLRLFSIKEAYYAAFMFDYGYCKNLTASARAEAQYSQLIANSKLYTEDAETGMCMLGYRTVCRELLLVRDLGAFATSFIALSTEQLFPDVELMLLHTIRTHGITIDADILDIMFGIYPRNKRKATETNAGASKSCKCDPKEDPEG
jgi:hypothetical protein